MVAGHLEVKNDLYYIVLSYTDENGKRKRPWFPTGIPAAKGNKRKAEQLLKEKCMGFSPPKRTGDLSSDMLFADYLWKWLEIKKMNIRPATYASYHEMIKARLDPYMREKGYTVEGLQARHIQMFYTELMKEVSANTVKHYHAIIHGSLSYAFKMDTVLLNVSDKVEKPRVERYEPVFLNADELRLVLSAVQGTRFEMLVLIAAFYGMRRGEVLGLKWDAIDFERGTISVLRTVVTALDESGKTVEIEQQCAKTKSGLRTLPLVSQFRDYFLQLRQAQELNKKICGNCYNHDYDGFVMVDEMGDRIKLDYLSSQFPIFLQRHGLKRMRFHDLRHSCASLLLANGVPLKCIQEWLGHSDFTITANIYAHLDYTSKLSSAQAMERGLPLPENDFGSRWVTVGYYDNAKEIAHFLPGALDRKTEMQEAFQN